MHQHYEDILSRINEPPAWFDDRGVPRFGEFSPQHLGNIYASEAALAEVSCQNCGTRFRVALTETFASKGFGLIDEIRLARVCYGDPPNIDCCGSGSSMTSIMHRILEYWSRDYEVSVNWQRDPTFEGPVADAPLDPLDTVAEVLAAVASGATAILVLCTSQRNRYDLAGRITAAMASDGRVLVAFPLNYIAVARPMLDGFVPNADIGSWNESRNVTLAEFSRLKDGHLATIEKGIFLAAPRPLNDAARKVWNDAATYLSAGTGGKVRVELTLAHSCRMIADPDVVVDAGRTD